MRVKKIIMFMSCLAMGIQLQATAVNSNRLNEWNISKNMEQPVTRQTCRVLLEETFNTTIHKPEFSTRPNEYITREEMALMIVNILGYEDIAARLKTASSTFKDVKENVGAIHIMKDLKLINGDNDSHFNPNKKLTGHEIATIIKRLSDRLNMNVKEVHSTYAIKSSDQIALIKNIDTLSFGWGQVEYDQIHKKISINTTSGNKNDFSVPLGFELPLGIAKQEAVETYFMVYFNDRPIDLVNEGKPMTLAAYIFNNPTERTSLIREILNASYEIAQKGGVTNFDGITIDFEDFYDASLQTGFNTFLKELKRELDKDNKKLNVAVQPRAYYKGYDYKTIGQIADRVILMAHDYAAKTLSDAEMQSGFTVTPITPIYAIYNALKEITDNVSGIDPSKVMLQISFASTQWQVKDNKIINRKPYTPSYDKLFARLQNPATEIIYSDSYQNPYAIYYDNNIKNVIWYENKQSVEAKIDLAKMFGINKISFWRLGTIPNYIDISGKNTQLDIAAWLAQKDK
ncbi:glycosyl hydrolase family 18 protein [Cellulosilyticum sp. I15G10I2]|uniref:glycosyl hydrolase family 18 protein n=1 Tax=Cellulosilyticum sp. I15G10I2 TaxID=1892843 RepID=UPI00085C1B43|nr:glycosyl hydrolase family 18 protein [Cellulosilyticum sp. I15G10I2]